MAPGVRRSEPAGARMVPPREGNEARGDGRRGIGAPHTTGEAGESCPRNPVEGRGRREMDPLAGKTANTPRLEPVSTLRQRIAERARHALGMAWVIFIASWTSGYATARSEAICRGAGCGRTRTSGSVGGQGQQRPWSTRPRITTTASATGSPPVPSISCAPTIARPTGSPADSPDGAGLSPQAARVVMARRVSNRVAFQMFGMVSGMLSVNRSSARDAQLEHQRELSDRAASRHLSVEKPPRRGNQR